MVNFIVEKPNATSYLIDGVFDPTLNLVRGQTYTFDFVDNGHPFFIKSSLGFGTSGRFDHGVINQGSSSADLDLVFTVPRDSPDILYYQCSAHPSMQGALQITDASIPTNSDIIQSSVSVIVAEGYLGPSPVLLEDLTESRTDNTWTIEYSGITFDYAAIDTLITIVTRDYQYTTEFRTEIIESFPEYSEITYPETLELVGVSMITPILLTIAAADGQVLD